MKDEEKKEFEEIEKILVPKIRLALSENHSDDIDHDTAVGLLHNTRIETDNEILRNTEEHNLAELEEALSEAYPGGSPLTMSSLRDIYLRLVILIVKRITSDTAP